MIIIYYVSAFAIEVGFAESFNKRFFQFFYKSQKVTAGRFVFFMASAWKRKLALLLLYRVVSYKEYGLKTFCDQPLLLLYYIMYIHMPGVKYFFYNTFPAFS